MKLGQAISWLMGGLQRSLFPHLEDCWKTFLTEKEQQLVSILEIVRVEKYVPFSSANQWMGRKLSERESIARSFAAKAVYGFPFTRSLIEDLKTTPTLRRICAKVVERFNSRMKEEFGANNVMVRGAQKVKMHLMFGVPALFADHLIKLAT